MSILFRHLRVKENRIDLWLGVLNVCSPDGWTLSRDPVAPRGGRTLLHGLHPPWDPTSRPTLCPMEQLGDGHPYLYLLDLILNPLDGVAVDVVPGVHLLLTDHFGPDHCKTQRHRGEQRPGDTIPGSEDGKGPAVRWGARGKVTPDPRLHTNRGRGLRDDTDTPGSRVLQESFVDGAKSRSSSPL